MRTIRVDLAASGYPIYIGAGVRSKLTDIIGGLAGVRQAAVIADARVAHLHLAALRACLPGATVVQTFTPGEPSKTLETFGRLLDGLADARIERSDVVVTFGGGIAGDLGGFVAASWLRGVRFIQVPTTIEAAVDASVGGKTAVNHKAGKNLIGAFHQPSAVVIDTDFLGTLDQRDFVAGLGESVKHAAIRDPEFLAWHEQHADAIVQRDPGVTAELIARNCAIKAEIVGQDEREHGVRAFLNYGHTIGHAIELLAEYRLRHGECVALGMIAENAMAVARGMLDADVAERIETLLARLGLPTRLPEPMDPTAILDACRMDKKNREGRINFVVLKALGEPERVENFSDDEVMLGAETVGADLQR